MTEFLAGVIGSLAVFLLMGIGGVIGWKAHKILRKPEVYQPVVPTDEERLEMKYQKEQQEAFRAMQNYNPDILYGTRPDDRLKGGDV